MTISAMAQHYGQPQTAPVSPNMYPQGSAVNFLGALAQQYHQQQQFSPEQFQQQQQHQYPEQFHQQQFMQQFPPHALMNPQLQHQYHQQMLMHQMQNQHHQQQMMAQQQQQQQQQPQNLSRDRDGYQYSIQHQQREMMQRQMQPQHQQGLLSPVPTQGLLSPRIASTPNSQTRVSPKSNNNHRKSPINTANTDTPQPKKTEAQTPVVKKTKPRTNFHSIADLVGENTSSKSPSPKPEMVKEEPSSTPTMRESLTEFMQRGKRRRTSDILNSSLDSDPGNLVIDEQRCNEFYPAAERRNQTTCSQPIRDANTPSRDYAPPMGDHYSTPAPPSRETSPGSDSRAVSPALSTISSIRDTDTPCSVASSDSFTNLSTRDEEKPPTTKKARSEDESGKRSSKSRRIFQAPQIHILEQVFAQCQYPEPAFVEKLARDLDTTDGKVRVWFQNKRARWRKRSHDNDQSKQSPWLPGTPLYAGQGQGQGQLSPVSMQQAQQQAAMQNGGVPQGGFTAMLQQGMPPQMHPQYAFMGMQ